MEHTEETTPGEVRSSDQLGGPRTKRADKCVTHHYACDCREDLMQRALAIADRSMFDLLETETIAHDEYRTVLGLTNEEQQEVASLPEASEAMQEAVAWLMKRGYVEMAEDPSGQYVNVLRRPGEDEDEDMEP